MVNARSHVPQTCFFLDGELAALEDVRCDTRDDGGDIGGDTDEVEESGRYDELSCE